MNKEINVDVLVEDRWWHKYSCDICIADKVCDKLKSIEALEILKQ